MDQEKITCKDCKGAGKFKSGSPCSICDGSGTKFPSIEVTQSKEEKDWAKNPVKSK